MTRKKILKRKPAPSSPERFSKGPLADMPEEIRANALLTTKEVAAMIGMSPTTVERWRWDGSAMEEEEDPLVYLRLVGNQIRYQLKDILSWLERRKVSGPSEERLIRPRGLQGVVGRSSRVSSAYWCRRSPSGCVLKVANNCIYLSLIVSRRTIH